MHSIAQTFRPAGAMSAGILAALLLGGCALLSERRTTPATDEPGQRTDMSRAEQVFRYQSRVANDVLDHYPVFDALEDSDPAVVAAEARMTDACSTLAQATLARFAGEELSLFQRLRVTASVHTCERAARDMDLLLNDMSVADSLRNGHPYPVSR